MNGYYDRQGNPIDMWTWSRLFEARGNSVGHDLVDDIRISTIWLGLDHNFSPHGPPLIFETMIFGLEDDELTEYQWRWSTEVQALAGHDQAVAMVREVLARRH